MAKQSGDCFIIFIVLLLSSCSSEKIQRQGDESLELFVNEIHSWVNLMPGSDSRFHITGDIDLLESSKYDFKMVKLVSVIVYHDNTEIFRISPFIQEDDTAGTQYKIIKFSTIRGLLLNNKLNFDQRINIDLVFNEGSSEHIYKIDNIKIYKAY